MSRRITMKEVASRAGLSASTVCRALSNSPQIPEATRAKVRAIAEEMGYRPDPLLSAFASRNRGKMEGSEITTIGYVTNFTAAFVWRTNTFYRKAFEGAARRADELGYKLEHFWLKEPGMTGARLSKILYNRGIAALCIAPTPQVRGHLSLDWQRFSCVTIGYSMLRPALHRATPHHYHAVQASVRELRRIGYRRIGFCSFHGTSKRVDDLWLAGWLVCQQNFRGMNLPLFLFDDSNRSKIADWCRAEKLEVVLGVEPIIVTELQRNNVFPELVDYASLNWDDHIPEIAGIDQRPDQIGAAAMDIVIGRMQRGDRGIPSVSMTTMVEGHWVPGPSLRKHA